MACCKQFCKPDNNSGLELLSVHRKCYFNCLKWPYCREYWLWLEVLFQLTECLYNMSKTMHLLSLLLHSLRNGNDGSLISNGIGTIHICICNNSDSITTTNHYRKLSMALKIKLNYVCIVYRIFHFCNREWINEFVVAAAAALFVLFYCKQNKEKNAHFSYYKKLTYTHTTQSKHQQINQ